MNESRKIKNYSDMLFNMQEAKSRRAKYLSEKEAKKATPEYMHNKEMREGWQHKHFEKETQRVNTVELLTKLKDYLKKHILDDLGLENEKQYDVTLDYETVSNVMKKYQPNINYLKENALTYEKLKGASRTYLYIILYRELIDINPIFLKFAPIETFYSAECLASLPKTVVREYKQAFQDKGYFEDSTFRETNGLLFTGVVDPKAIKSFDVARKELMELPELYSELSPSMKNIIMTSPKAMPDLLRHAPKILKYMTNEELEFAVTFSPAFGQAIVKCPDVLTNFPKNFFIKHPADRMFKNCSYPKSTIYLELADYMDDFVGLKEYLVKYAPKHSKDTDTIIGI